MTPVYKGALLSLGAALGAALFYLPYKQAGTLTDRDVVVMTTMLVAAIFNSGAAFAAGLHNLRFDRIALVSALVLGVLTVVGNLGTAMALGYVDAGVIGSLQQTQILFVPMASFVLLGERVSARFAVGTAIVLFGIAIMRITTSGGAGVHLLGIAWALLSAFCFALMHVITRKVIDRIQVTTVNALRLWFSVVVLLCVPGNAGTLVGLDGEVWALCAAAGFAGPFLSRVAIMNAVRHITASHSSMISLVVPLLAFTLDYAILGAVPTVWQLLGAGVMLVGVSLPVLELMANESRPQAAPPGKPARS